ncbi:hypothetical protein [Niabella ginsenosidivorans]|nr:hypothetical protein [Niabella ginsenosidivorans]
MKWQPVPAANHAGPVKIAGIASIVQKTGAVAGCVSNFKDAPGN